MILKRTYSIIYTTPKNEKYYIKELIKYNLGYRFHSSKDIELSEVWKNKKSVDKVVKNLNSGLFEPGFDREINRTYHFETIEITPQKILRRLKLKKIMKKLKLTVKHYL